MVYEEYTELTVMGISWNKTAGSACAELSNSDGPTFKINLDSLSAAQLLRMGDSPNPHDGRIHDVAVNLLLDNGYLPEAIYLSLDFQDKISSRLIYQKNKIPGFLELHPGDSLAFAMLLKLPIRAHKNLLNSFLKTANSRIMLC